MKKQSLLYFLIIFFCISLSAQSQSVMWEDMSAFSEINTVLKLTHDNKILCSGAISYSSDFSARFSKYELNGSLVWQKQGRLIKGGPTPFVLLNNGNILTAGHSPTGAFSPYAVDVFMQQLNLNGDTVAGSAYTFNAPDSTDWVINILKESDSSFILSGYTMGQDQMGNYSLRKVDLAGNTIWRKTYAKDFNAYGTYTIRNRNNELILYGTSTHFSQVPLVNHPYLVKTSATGDSLLAKQIVVLDSTKCESISLAPNNIIQTANGDYLFSGRINDCNSSVTRAFVGRVDSAFNLVWGYEHMQQTSLSFWPAKVRELEDGSILLLASDMVAQSDGFYLIRISASGQFISQTSLQSQVCPEGKMRPSDWLILPDSSIVVGGMCQVNNQAYIGRWGNLGLPTVQDTTTLSTSEVSDAITIQVQPNPNSGEFSLSYSPQNKEGQLFIYDVLGKLVHQEAIAQGSQVKQVNLPQLSQGVYHSRLVWKGKSGVVRFVKQ